MKSSDQRWRRLLRTAFSVVFFFPLFGHCLNTEALALMKFKERIEKDPFRALLNWGELPHHCSWSGVVCSHNGRVVILNLQDLSLQGTLAPELGNLTYLKSLLLRNNSFSGKVPKEVTELQELEVLDLCDNDFGQPFSFSRRLLQFNPPDSDPFPPPPPTKTSSVDPFLSPPPPPLTRSDSPPADSPIPDPPLVPPPPPPKPSVSPPASKKKIVFVIVGVIVGVLFIVVALLVFFLYKKHKVALIRSYTSTSNRQLHQNSVITGVPKLKLSELETACEDFSNIIGYTSSNAIIYKGTLSTGSEIAVLSVASGSFEDWPMDLETQFQEKIERLSQVNHKNFLNLIGYCHENEPFNRMLVFEYAPNGSLFEHLHGEITEQEDDAEHLDWRTRLRIAMGIAYCVEHLQIPVPNLNSSSVYLALDYAAKVADFTFHSSTTTLDPMTNNVFSFGVILHEIITGKPPDPDSPLPETKPVPDPTLKSFDADVMGKLYEVVRECLNQNQSLEMKVIAAKLKEITGITEEVAFPGQSPAWWAELEILSTEAN